MSTTNKSAITSRPPARSPARYRLRFHDRELEIRGVVVFGRAQECDVVLEGGLVSRRHARLHITEEGLNIEDLGSRNGVYVNQQRIVEPTLVAHGDVIAIGIESFEVIDTELVQRAEHLSTLPPPSQRVPIGEADVDAPDSETIAARVDVLTAREREVFELIVLGHTQREIATKLHVSVKTIETHRARVVEKLNCKTRAELVAYAISAGMLRGK